MKSFYLSIPIIFLFLIGCSHTYEVSKYYSKDDLYKEFNNSAQDKELKIDLINNSSLFVSNGAKIRTDSMIFNNKILFNYNSQLPISEIKQASYNNHWKGVVPGFLIGGLGGAIIGSRFKDFQDTFVGAFGGILVGSIVGYVFGYHYYFQFNP